MCRAYRPVLGQRLAESFFASLKGELTETQPWPTRAAARRAIVEYIDWYNGTLWGSITLSWSLTCDVAVGWWRSC